MESLWARMQVELLNRRRWKTRIELAAAIHDYIELWHNPRRRHSGSKMRTPDEVENAWLQASNGQLEHADAAAVAGARLRLAPGTAADQADRSAPPVTMSTDDNHAA
jgi:hypothetical protein